MNSMLERQKEHCDLDYTTILVTSELIVTQVSQNISIS